jgi:lipopolysaccharide transport system permease protein|tara:strand:- start:1361 stop:2191 length:831 start_codon:yes stop_codon:yes gene_type:complete
LGSNTTRYRADPLYIPGSIVEHRFVIGQLAKRAILGRYRGTVLGLLWSLVTPLLLLAVYTFVFGTILQVRWVSQSGGNAEFAAILFSGMLVHGILAECLTQASTLIVANPQYVKKVVFPLEALPWVTVISAFFQGVISTGILLAYLFFVQGGIPWTAVLFPIPLFVLAFVCIAAGWLISATAVYLKDIAQMMGLLSTVLFFMAPILYPKTALPVEFQNLLYLNPLTYIIEQFRAVVLWGELPNWNGLALYGIASVAIAWMSLAWFQKTRKGFADVL